MGYFGFCKGIKQLGARDVKEISVYEDFFARFYDNCIIDTFDIALYKELAGIYGKRILELACGSGRILVPLMQEDYRLTGVDDSPDMLNLLRKKIAEHPLQPELILADITGYKSKEEQDLVILGHVTICLFTAPGALDLLFRRVQENLRTGGVFVFNYMNTDLDRITDDEKRPQYFFNPKEKSFVVIYEKLIKASGIALINFYGEQVDEAGYPQRYLAKTEKKLLNKSMIRDFGAGHGFHLTREQQIKIGNDDMVFSVFRKL